MTIRLGRFACLVGVSTLLVGCTQVRTSPYPLGIYSVPKANLADVHQAGFNLVTGPAQQEYLDAAAHQGVKVLASPGTTAGSGFNAARARQAVQRFDAHPALWGWYLSDEPDLNAVPPEQVKLAHRFLKNLGAQKPTALVLYQGAEALNFANITDVTMVDRYPIPWLPLANFPQHVRMARLALGKEKPLVAVIQAFDWTSYPRLAPDYSNLRAPTREELRCMVYCALARQANGIFFYCFDDGSWKLLQHPPVWQAVQSTAAEINQRLPLFEAEHVWWPYRHEFGDPATGFNAALESSITPALLRVKHGNRSVLAGDYVLAVNNTDRQLSYKITLPGPPQLEVSVLGEDRRAAVEDGLILDNFGPFDVHIYGPIAPPVRR